MDKEDRERARCDGVNAGAGGAAGLSGRPPNAREVMRKVVSDLDRAASGMRALMAALPAEIPAEADRFLSDVFSNLYRGR